MIQNGATITEDAFGMSVEELDKAYSYLFGCGFIQNYEHSSTKSFYESLKNVSITVDK